MRTIDLYGDCQAGILVGPGGYAINSNPVFFGGDKWVMLHWHLRRYNDEDKQVYAAYPVAIGSTFQLVAKKIKNYEGTSVIFSSADLFGQEGDWPAAKRADGEIPCRLDLNKNELLALLTDTVESVSVIFDLEEIDTDGNNTTILQFTATVKNQVSRGNEGDPTPATPTYYPVAEADAKFALQSPADANYRTLNGKTRQYFCPETGFWHTVRIVMREGIAVLAVDQEGML
jgi:hypothetical protein